MCVNVQLALQCNVALRTIVVQGVKFCQLLGFIGDRFTGHGSVPMQEHCEHTHLSFNVPTLKLQVVILCGYIFILKNSKF